MGRSLWQRLWPTQTRQRRRSAAAIVASRSLGRIEPLEDRRLLSAGGVSLDAASVYALSAQADATSGELASSEIIALSTMRSGRLQATADEAGVTILSPSGDLLEGAAINLSASVTGASNPDTLVYTWTVRKDDAVFATGSGASFSLVPDDEGTYTVALDVVLDGALWASDTASLTVGNAAPVLGDVQITSLIDENGVATLSGTLADAGSLDALTLLVSWGDGSEQTFTFAAGTANFTETHQYLDDTPTGTAHDELSVGLAVFDSDDGSATASTSLIVRNVAPVATIVDAPADATEGTAITLKASVTDVGTLDTLSAATWAVTRGSSTVASGAGTSLTFTPDDEGTYSVLFTAVDDDSGEGATTATIVVQNSGTSLASVSVTPVVDENGVATLTGEILDAGTGDSFTLVVDWGEGVAQTYVLAAGTTAFTQTHQYLDDNPTATPSDQYLIRLTLTDGDGATESAQLTTTVANVAPTVSIVNAPSDSLEGTEITLQANVTDPGSLDQFAYAWTVTKDGALFATGTESTIAFTPDDGGNYQVSLRVKDDDSGQGTAVASIVVANVAPDLRNASATASVNENQKAVTLRGDIVDPGLADTFSVTVDWGDGSTETFSYPAGTASFAESHMYLDDAPTGTAWDSYTIRVTLSDDDGALDKVEKTTRVNNVAPVVSIEGVPSQVVAGRSVALSSLLVDPGFLDTHSYLWIVEQDGSVVATGSDVGLIFTPPDEGMYTISLTVTDDDTGAGVDTISIFADPPGPGLGEITLDASVTEGDSVTLAAGIVDPSGSTNYTVEVDWGMGDEPETFVYPAGTAGFSLAHVYADNGDSNVLSLAVRINGSDPYRLATQVFNAAPALVPAASALPATLGTPISQVLAQFSDAGVADLHTATIDWGDGTVEAGVVAQKAGSGSVSGTHTYGADGIYTVCVTVADDDGGTTTSTLEVYVASPLGTVDYLALDALAGDAEGRLYRFDTTRAGFLTVEAVFAGVADDVVLRLYDDSLNFLVESEGSDGESRIDWEADGTATYYLAVIGILPEIDLRLANLVSRVGTTLSVAGSAGEDAFVFVPGTSLALSVNGIAYTFDLGYTQVLFEGGDGADSADITGTSLPDSVVLHPGSAMVTGGLTIGVQETEAITVRGGADDVALLYDSTGGDTFTASPTEATLTGDGFTNRAIGFPSVTAVASNAEDAAELTGSEGSDTFTGTSEFGRLLGDDFFLKALRFKQIAVCGGGGDDVARFYDTASYDTFSAQPGAALFVGGGLTYSVEAFSEMHAFSENGGGDAAFLVDNALGNDVYEGSPTDGKLFNADYATTPVYFLRARGFASVAVESTGGDDTATLYGSAGNETFTAQATEATLVGDGFSHALSGFPGTHAVGKGGANDRAFYYGSAAVEAFAATYVYGRWAGTTSEGQSFLYRAVRFDRVTAITESSDDIARFYGSEYGDTFEAAPFQARMVNRRSDNRAQGFSGIHAFADEAASNVAYLTDSAGDDTLIGRPAEVKLYNNQDGQTNFFLRAAGFDVVYATASMGGEDWATLDDSSAADVFSAESDWAAMAAANLAYSQRYTGFGHVTARSKTKGDDDAVQTTTGILFDLALEGDWET